MLLLVPISDCRRMTHDAGNTEQPKKIETTFSLTLTGNFNRTLLFLRHSGTTMSLTRYHMVRHFGPHKFPYTNALNHYRP